MARGHQSVMKDLPVRERTSRKLLDTQLNIDKRHFGMKQRFRNVAPMPAVQLEEKARPCLHVDVTCIQTRTRRPELSLNNEA